MKFDKDSSDYIDFSRRYRLIKGEEADPMLLAANKIAALNGLISTYGEMKILKINGEKKGHYYLVEDIKKEYLEREFGITNYCVLSNLTDWKRRESVSTGLRHLSPHNLSYTHIENDDHPLFPEALHMFELLSECIKNGDVKGLNSMIDKEYIGKFMACAALFNDIHWLTGDNVKLIFDFSTGKFFPQFRMESGGRDIYTEWSTTFPNLNKFIFHSFKPGYENEILTQMFRMFLMDNEVRNKRDEHLHELYSNQSGIKDILNNVYEDNHRVMLRSGASRRAYNLEKVKQINRVNLFLKLAKQHVNYSHIYCSIDSVENRIYISPDSFSPISVQTRDSSLNHTGLNGLNLNLDLDFDINEFDFPVTNRNFKESNYIFINEITGDTIPKKNVFFNYIKKSRPVSKSASIEENLNSLNINFTLDENALWLNKGEYRVTSDLSFPPDLNVKINEGAHFFLDENVNIHFSGNLDILGTETNKVQFVTSSSSTKFGAILIKNQNQSLRVSVNHLIVSGGKGGVINGMGATGQFAIYNCDAVLKNSEFTNSAGDDGLNLKFCKVVIEDCVFKNNLADQVDLDFCFAKVKHCSFLPSKIDANGDGLDLSGSYCYVENCNFDEFLDKGLSLGEQSKVFVNNCSLSNCDKGIVIKDATTLYANNNTFLNNRLDLYAYIKKKIFSKPIVFRLEENDTSLDKVIEGDLIQGKISSSDLERELDGFESDFEDYVKTGSFSDRSIIKNMIESE